MQQTPFLELKHLVTSLTAAGEHARGAAAMVSRCVSRCVALHVALCIVFASHCALRCVSRCASRLRRIARRVALRVALCCATRHRPRNTVPATLSPRCVSRCASRCASRLPPCTPACRAHLCAAPGPCQHRCCWQVFNVVSPLCVVGAHRLICHCQQSTGWRSTNSHQRINAQPLSTWSGCQH